MPSVRNVFLRRPGQRQDKKSNTIEKTFDMTRLSTTYLGMKLRSPIVVSACTLSESVDNIVRMEDSGAGAVVMFSMFEEQIRKEDERMNSILQSTSNVFAEAADYFPDMDEYHVATHNYLETIRKAKSRRSSVEKTRMLDRQVSGIAEDRPFSD